MASSTRHSASLVRPGMQCHDHGSGQSRRRARHRRVSRPGKPRPQRASRAVSTTRCTSSLHKALPPSMGPGQNVILSIQAAQSNGPMLAVPEAALFGGQDGKDYVSKVTGPDTATRVQVTVVTEGDGLVGIRPAPAGALKPGDQVVTGENYLTSPHGGSSGKARLVPGGSSGSGSVRSWGLDDRRRASSGPWTPAPPGARPAGIAKPERQPRAARPETRSSGSPQPPTPTAARRRSRRSSRPAWSSTGASTSRSPGRRARASRRCSTCSACSTSPPRARSRSTGSTWARRRSVSAPRSARTTSDSSSSRSTCCPTAPRSRT